jgi:hypothetical protein
MTAAEPLLNALALLLRDVRPDIQTATFRGCPAISDTTGTVAFVDDDRLVLRLCAVQLARIAPECRPHRHARSGWYIVEPPDVTSWTQCLIEALSGAVRSSCGRRRSLPSARCRTLRVPILGDCRATRPPRRHHRSPCTAKR